MKRLLKRGKQYSEASDSGDYLSRAEGHDLEAERSVQDRDLELSASTGASWLILSALPRILGISFPVLYLFLLKICRLVTIFWTGTDSQSNCREQTLKDRNVEWITGSGWIEDWGYLETVKMETLQFMHQRADCVTEHLRFLSVKSPSQAELYQVAWQ